MDNRKFYKRIIFAIGEFVLLVLLALVPPLLVFLDGVVIQHPIVELCFTECIQEALLLISTLIFGCAAWQYSSSRGFLVLVGGFFGCMLMREFDGFWDYVWHGFWVWPVTFLAAASTLYAMAFCRDTILEPMARFIDTKAYLHIMFGLIFLLFFSRVFGSGTFLWRSLLGHHYTTFFKCALQEGLELFGYIFICYGSFVFLWEKSREEK